jgi:hypothetical protein
MNLQFDDATHTYKIDGQPVPSVTSIIRSVLGNPYGPASGQWHMDRGNAAHDLYEILGKGDDLALYEYDMTLDGHVRLWREWYSAECPVIIQTEMAVASKRYGYAGTMDAVLDSAILSSKFGGITILDYKQTVCDRDRLQLAAYAIAYEEMTGNTVTALMPLQINGTDWRYGEIVCDKLGIQKAKSDWLAVLRVWQLQNGKK